MASTQRPEKTTGSAISPARNTRSTSAAALSMPLICASPSPQCARRRMRSPRKQHVSRSTTYRRRESGIIITPSSEPGKLVWTPVSGCASRHRPNGLDLENATRLLAARPRESPTWASLFGDRDRRFPGSEQSAGNVSTHLVSSCGWRRRANLIVRISLLERAEMLEDVKRYLESRPCDLHM